MFAQQLCNVHAGRLPVGANGTGRHLGHDTREFSSPTHSLTHSHTHTHSLTLTSLDRRLQVGVENGSPWGARVMQNLRQQVLDSNDSMVGV